MATTCKRCLRPHTATVVLYVGLMQEPIASQLIPLAGLSLQGGTLDICPDCHAEWVAAMKTWFENPTMLRAVPDTRGTERSS